MKKIILIPVIIIFHISCFETSSQNLVDTPEIEEMSYNPPLQLEQETPVVSRDFFSPQKIIQAFKRAYPEKISEITFRQNDWAMKVYDQWYYWAEGRLLPENLILQKEKYSPYFFNNYPENLPEFTELSEDTKMRLDSVIQERKKEPLQRYPGFLNSLWRIYDRETSWARVKTTYFLGFKLQIHRDLLEDLAVVEEEIQRRMLVDSELRNFVRSLNRIDAYNWRRIAETETLSVHSYGIALDLILRHSGNQEVYWLWTQNKGLNFYDQPYNKRFSPPDSFIKAFEKHGFIWGGKWLFFDTIHFEYRPEILILNNLME